MEQDRIKLIQDTYIRVCKDSEYNLHWEDAAVITSDILEILPLTVGFVFPKMGDLNLIALGRHPAAPNPKLKLMQK
jgi:hypothetical protein